MNAPLASVVIPTLNGAALFERALDKILAQKADFAFDVTVIDSGSQDGTVAMVRRRPVQLLEIPKSEFNHGLTRDRAIAATGGAFVALTVQDAEPLDEHWLAGLVRAVQE